MASGCRSPLQERIISWQASPCRARTTTSTVAQNLQPTPARLQMLCLRPRHRIYLTHSLKELDSVREDEKLPWSISGKINGWNTRMSCIRVY